MTELNVDETESWCRRCVKLWMPILTMRVTKLPGVRLCKVEQRYYLLNVFRSRVWHVKLVCAWCVKAVQTGMWCEPCDVVSLVWCRVCGKEKTRPEHRKAHNIHLHLLTLWTRSWLTHTVTSPPMQYLYLPSLPQTKYAHSVTYIPRKTFVEHTTKIHSHYYTTPRSLLPCNIAISSTISLNHNTITHPFHTTPP